MEVSNKHLVIRCTVKLNELFDNPNALFDTGAIGEIFIDKKYAQQQGFPTIFLIRFIPLQGFDGNATGSGPVIHFVYIFFVPPGHKPQFTRFFLTDIFQFLIIINLPWMRSKFTTIRLKPDISTINFEHLEGINQPGTTPEKPEMNLLTQLGNSGLFFSTLLAETSNYRFPSVKKIPDEGEHDLMFEELLTFKKRNFSGQRNQERKKARILKKGEKFSELLKGGSPRRPLRGGVPDARSRERNVRNSPRKIWSKKRVLTT